MLILSHPRSSPASHLKQEYPIALPETRFPLENYLAIERKLYSPMPSTSDLSLHRNSGTISADSVLAGSMTSSSSNPNSRPHSPVKAFDFSPGSITPPTPPYSPVLTDDHDFLPASLSPQDDYLQFIEPGPICPPRYDSTPPGGCPRFPILSPLSLPCDENLPSYSPTIYKIGIVSRKIEWLTPYEASPSRSWKHLIMELNSTQLNFYSIPTALENHLLSFRPSTVPGERYLNQEERVEVSNFKSLLTSDEDLQFMKYCQRLGLLNSSNCIESSTSSPGLNPVLYNTVSNNNNFIPLTSKDQKLLKNSKHKKLLRSYSLQYTRLGLATDYKKRANVLRLRIESEQVLLNFSTTRDLIEWNTAISIGKDVALDLNEREMPHYRTVPRRRRSNRRFPADDAVFYQNSLNHSTMNLSGRSFTSKARKRAQSDPKASFDPHNSNSTFKNKLSKLKTKLSPSASSRSNSTGSMSDISKMRSPSQARQRSATVGVLSTIPSNGPVDSIGSRLSSLRSNSVPSFSVGYEEYEEFDGDVDYDDDDDEVESCLDPNNGPGGVPHDEEDEEDIHNLSDLHRSDDEDDEDEDDEVEYGDDQDDVALFYADIELENDGIHSRRNNDGPSSSYAYGDFKWHPAPDKPPSQRKFYRNCLRCIKPLTSEDSWVTRSVVKPTTISPLNLYYLKNMKYDPSKSISNPSSNTSLVSLVSSSSLFNTTSGTTSSIGSRKKSFSKDIPFGLLDSSLSRIPNHYLKEYTVGTHGLIPRLM